MAPCPQSCLFQSVSPPEVTGRRRTWLWLIRGRSGTSQPTGFLSSLLCLWQLWLSDHKLSRIALRTSSGSCCQSAQAVRRPPAVDQALLSPSKDPSLWIRLTYPVLQDPAESFPISVRLVTSCSRSLPGIPPVHTPPNFSSAHQGFTHPSEPVFL